MLIPVCINLLRWYIEDLGLGAVDRHLRRTIFSPVYLVPEHYVNNDSFVENDSPLMPLWVEEIVTKDNPFALAYQKPLFCYKNLTLDTLIYLFDKWTQQKQRYRRFQLKEKLSPSVNVYLK